MSQHNPFIQDLSKLATGAVGALAGAKSEAEAAIRQRLELYVAELDFVPREEFDAVALMAQKAREENEALKSRIEALESKITGNG